MERSVFAFVLFCVYGGITSGNPIDDARGYANDAVGYVKDAADKVKDRIDDARQAADSARQWTVEMANSADDTYRAAVVGTVDGRPDVHCNDPITDKQCPRDDITFWLYTRDRQDNPHQLNPRDENSIRDAPFVQNLPVKILVHGYTMNKDTAINEVLRPAYFRNGDLNVISVDWSAICPQSCYTQAAQSIPTVGACVASFVRQLTELRQDLGEVHILGHSMGAHVTAWASAELDLDRVTQFDPALPLFSSSSSQLLKYPRGHYVDVWHSNSGIKGRSEQSGTVDVFFNDGMDQPGCKCDTSCSHLRAVEYYAETVGEQRPLKAFPCSGYQEYKQERCPVPTVETLRDFGEQFSPDATGSYLAFTNAQPPFAVPGEEYTDGRRFRGFAARETGSYLAFTNAQPPFTVPGEEYTDQGRFRGFSSREQGCAASHLQKGVSGALGV